MSPKKGPHQQRAILTRERIIRAAGEEFATHGYPDARIPRVSLAAGVSSGAVVFHFPKKRDLALAVCAQHDELLAEALNVEPGSDASGIAEAYQQLARLFLSDPVVQAGFRLYAESSTALGLDAASPQISLEAHTRHLLQSDQRQEVPPGDVDFRSLPEVLVASFVGSYFQSIALTGGSDFPDRISRLLDVVLPKPRTP